MNAMCRMTVGLTLLACTGAVAVGEGRGRQAAAGGDAKIAALKQSLQQSQANLRKYEWIETTIVSLKGEEKSRTQKRCYYGADGTLEKLPLGPEAPPAPPPTGGRRGARLKGEIVEHKKEELQDYMKQAVALVHGYVPPKPADIEKAKQAGKLVVRPGQGGQAQVEFTDYLKPGDKLTIGINGAAATLTDVNVASYLDKPEDAVTLAVTYGTLTDGTSYVAQSTLDAKAKQMQVVIQNAGHRPLSQ